jgi:hypothetical protein
MAALEKHFTVKQLAELWALSEDTIRRLFAERFDVLKVGSSETRSKRKYFVLRIPESVAQKVHAELRGRKAA